MSNQPNNNRFNQNRDYSMYSVANTETNQTKDTFLKNGSNIIKNYSSSTTRRESDTLNPYVMESKIKDLEAKLSNLEQTNQMLIERLNNNERNFQIQLKQIQVSNLEEKENRYKAEKVISNISEQNNANSNDLNLKINMLQEALVKGENEKMLQRQNDLESQKYLIGKLTEKITKTVKSEVEARYKADMDGKIFSQKINNKFENSLDILKKEIEEITNQTRAEMQNISRECSERTHNVSKYIDKQISEAIFGKGSANEELKNFVKKLTEQVKSGLTLISQKNEMMEHRMDSWEKKEKENKKDILKLMNDMEQRLLKKAKDVKLFSEVNISRHDAFLEKNIDNIMLKLDKNIQFLAGQLIETRNKVNQRFEKIFQDHHYQFKIICEDLQKICERIYKYEDNLKKYENSYNETRDKVYKYMADTYARNDIHIIQERILHTIECNFMQEEINKLNYDIRKNGADFNENLNDFMTKTRDNVQEINGKLREQKNSLIEMGDRNLEMFDKVDREREVIEVHQIMNEMITRVDNAMMIDSLQESKNTEFKIMETLQEHKINITDSIKEINVNKKDISALNNKVNNLEGRMNESNQNMKNMDQRMNVMKEESNELDIKEGVAKVMENMLNFVENAITKEKMDKMGEYDFNSMRKTIITMEEQISILSGTTAEIDTMHKDIQKLYEETETLKNKPKGGDDIKLATIQMLNNVEFENIYSILNSGNLANGQSGGENVNYSEMMENKINKALEKIKDDNEKMWINVVQMKDKVTDPEEIKKILNQVHPAIVNSSDASKIIDEVGPYEDQTYMPKVNGFDMIKQKNNENNFYNNNVDYNYKNQQDPGPDINSKKSSKKSGSKKSNKSKVNETNNNNINNNKNEEKKSQISKKSKTSKASKIEEAKKAEEEKKQEDIKSKNSKNSKKSKAEEVKNNDTENKEESKSNKSKQENTPGEEDQVNQNMESKKTNQENEEDEYEEDEDDNNEEQENKNGTNEELQGKLKKNEEISGKSLAGIKK